MMRVTGLRKVTLMSLSSERFNCESNSNAIVQIDSQNLRILCQIQIPLFKSTFKIIYHLSTMIFSNPVKSIFHELFHYHDT